MRTRKFMQTLDNKLYSQLERIARNRGITVQQLLRAVIVPEWFKDESSPAGGNVGVGRSGRRKARRMAARVAA